MLGMLPRVRDRVCGAWSRLRPSLVPAVVLRIAFYLLTVYVMAGLWRLQFEPLTVVGWRIGIPAIFELSCAEAAAMFMLAALAAWWLAAPARHIMLRFGLWLWRSNIPVALLVCILLLRGQVFWGPIALLAACALWLPFAVSFPVCNAGCDSASTGRPGGRWLDVPPHLPARTAPLVACCIAFMVVALCALVLAETRSGYDGVVLWTPSEHVVASWSMVCCCCAIAALAYACRFPRRCVVLALSVLAAPVAWVVGKVPMGAALAPYGVSLAFTVIVCIWFQMLRRAPASALDRSAGIAFFPVGVMLSSLMTISLDKVVIIEPMALLALELMGAALLVAQALQTRGGADVGRPDGSCGDDHGVAGRPTTARGSGCQPAEAQATCARLAARHGLTAREESVICAMAEGRSLAQIARAEGITKSTAGTYAARAYVKLGASSRAEALDIVQREMEREAQAHDGVGGTASLGGHEAPRAAGGAAARGRASGAHARRVAAVAGLFAWPLLAEAFVLPWLSAAQPSWLLRGEAVPVVAFLVTAAVLMQMSAGGDNGRALVDGSRGDALGHTESARLCRSGTFGAPWLQAVALVALIVLALAPEGMSWAAMRHIGRGAVALVACSSGVAAVALAFHVLRGLWSNALPSRGLAAVPMAASLAFGCGVCSGVLVPVVLACGVACAAVILVCGRMGTPLTPAPAVGVSCGGKLRAERSVSLRIGLVRSVALAAAGASGSVLYYLLDGSYLALRPCWVASLVWHLVVHGVPLAAALYASMQAGRFARRMGRSAADVVSTVVVPGLLGFACGGAFVELPVQPHMLGVSAVALIAAGMLCGAWALASVVLTFRRRLAFSRRVDTSLSSVLAGTGVSDAELPVLAFLLRGFSTADIARELVVSLNTVRTHVRHIYAKLGIHSRAELFDAMEQLFQGYEDRL